MECGNFSNLGPSYKCIWSSNLGGHPLVHLVVLITNDCIAQGKLLSLLPDVSAPQDCQHADNSSPLSCTACGRKQAALTPMAGISSKFVSTDFGEVPPELLFFPLSVPPLLLWGCCA